MNKTIIKLSVIFIVILSFFSVFSQTPANSQNDDRYQRLNNYIESEIKKNNIPGLAIAVVENNDVTFVKTYDRKNNSIDEDTPFYIGSLSKSFSALAIMQLHEKGMLDIDKPVKYYIPYFEVNNDLASSTITIRHLINQTSGLTDAKNPEMVRPSPTAMEDLKRFKNITPNAAPGEKFQYFNNNYIVLDLIIQEVTGKSYGDYIYDNILNPLNMNNSFVPYEIEDRERIVQGHARFFGFSLPSKQPFSATAAPAGYIAASINDLGQYLKFNLNASLYSDILSIENVNEMHTVPNNTESIYGMGWFVLDVNSQKRVFHGGDNERFHTDMIMLPEENLGIALLINQNNFSNAFLFYQQFNDNIISILLDEPVRSTLTLRIIEIVLFAMFVLSVAGISFKIIRFSKWKDKNKNKSNVKIFFDALFEILIPILILSSIFIVFNLFFKRAFIFSLAFQMQPDLMIWLLVSIVLGAVYGLRKFIYLIKKNKHTLLEVR